MTSEQSPTHVIQKSLSSLITSLAVFITSVVVKLQSSVAT